MNNVLRPVSEVEETLDHPESLGLPNSLSRRKEEVLTSLGLRRAQKLEKLLQTIKDPQILTILGSIIAGGLATAASEHENLQNKDVFDYVISLVDYYINTPDKAENAGKIETLARVISTLSKIGIAVGAGAEILDRWKSRQTKEKDIENGIHPCPYQNHVVGLGLRDPLIFAEDEAGKSFVRGVREDFGQLVVVQKRGPYYHPEELGIEMNNHRMFANLEALQDGTPLAEMTNHIIVSGSYKASGILINAQKGHELFEEFVIDKAEEEAGFRPDLAMAGYFVKNSARLRQAVTTLTDPLTVGLVVPMFMRQKYADHSIKGGRESWARAVLSNFGDANENVDLVSGVIIPEEVFIRMLADQIEGLNDPNLPVEEMSIYIDAEGQDQDEVKSIKCKKVLEAELARRGLEVKEIFVSSKDARKANVSIMLRGSNRNIDASSKINKNRLGHQYVFYPATTRKDIVAHEAGEGETQRRIPILYKQEVAKLSQMILRGEKNQYSVSELKAAGRL